MPTYDKPYEVKPNTGSIRATQSKRVPESPDYFGSFKLDMRSVEVVNNIAEFKLSGWKAVDKSGKTYLIIKLNDYKGEDSNQRQVKEDDSDIPF
jgi:hypothetical protein